VIIKTEITRIQQRTSSTSRMVAKTSTANKLPAISIIKPIISMDGALVLTINLAKSRGKK